MNSLRLPAHARSLAVDRTTLALCLVFLSAAAFYLWTAGTSYPLALQGSQTNPYNRLADAFLHFHLAVGRAPAGLLRLADPYNPVENETIRLHFSIHDYVLYNRRLYLTWGPAPAIVLLVPMHLLGFEPSSSVIVTLFAIVGLGFALATLRVILRQIGNTALWMCVLAALTLALSSVVPIILRRPAIYEEAIGGGYCFAMAGIWLAVSTLAQRRASLVRLALMSLCFGLAAGSRPTLGLTALVLVPVYMSLRSSQSRRGLLTALAVPVCGCFLLLAAYNQARFGNPLEFGTKYQLAGFNSQTAHFADTGYMLPGAWFYLVSPPRPAVLFPFIGLGPTPISDLISLPAHYSTSEITGGLLPMTPIAIFLVALPWISWRRPALLGPLAAPLLVLAGAGIASLLFLSYEFFATTERYEVDFTTLFLLGALAAWLALADEVRGTRRRLVRTGGGLLAAWGCLTGLAISFTGEERLLAASQPGIWSALVDIGSPLSTALATAAGRPVLGEASAPNLSRLSVGDRMRLTIVSPDTREAALLATMTPGAERGDEAPIELGTGASRVLIRGPGHASYTYPVPPGGGRVRIPVHLRRGLNHLVLSPIATAVSGITPGIPASQQLLAINNLSLASRN
jgi:hypothetical protein